MLNSNDAPHQVLVVEDDQSIAKMLQWSLRIGGFKVTAVATGEEALKVLERESISLVILDLVLPDDGAPQVLERLRRWNNHPQWMVLSAMDPNEAAHRYGPMGDRFMPKPFDPWLLMRKLNRLLAADGPSQAPPNPTQQGGGL
jgi:two-component system response regulator TctD